MEKDKIYERYNTDDVFNRSVIVGLLNLMNNSMTYEQVWDDSTTETVSVPVMYDFGSSDERFAQDNYAFFGNSCYGGKMITGKFDMYPRCAIRYTGSQIDSANVTNRFVRGTYMKNENGKLVTYTSYLYTMPLTFNFDAEIWVDNIISAFKIEERLRDTFYKNKTYNVLYRGMKVGCRAGFPESSTTEKTTEYSFDSDRKIKITFSIAVEAYQPVFDKTTEMEADKYIKNVAWDVKLGGQGDAVQRIEIDGDAVSRTAVYPSGTSIHFRWRTDSNISDMCTLLLSYIDEDGTEHAADEVIYNQGEYAWHIPEGFTDYVQPNISYVLPDGVSMTSTPVVKIVPDASTGIVGEGSFTVLNGGRFLCK